MKNLFILIPLLIFSCKMVPDNPMTIEGATPIQIMKSIESQIIKIRDIEKGKVEYWQTPEETLAIGQGDCDDICILFMYELNKIGVDSQLVIQGSLIPGFHTYVKIKKMYYDPTYNLIYFSLINIIEVLSYEDVMKYTYSNNFPDIKIFFD